MRNSAAAGRFDAGDEHSGYFAGFIKQWLKPLRREERFIREEFQPVFGLTGFFERVPCLATNSALLRDRIASR